MRVLPVGLLAGDTVLRSMAATALLDVLYWPDDDMMRSRVGAARAAEALGTEVRSADDLMARADEHGVRLPAMLRRRLAKSDDPDRAAAELQALSRNKYQDEIFPAYGGFKAVAAACSMAEIDNKIEAAQPQLAFCGYVLWLLKIDS